MAMHTCIVHRASKDSIVQGSSPGFVCAVHSCKLRDMGHRRLARGGTLVAASQAVYGMRARRAQPGAHKEARRRACTAARNQG